MLKWSDIFSLFFEKSLSPSMANGDGDDLPYEGLTMGTLYIGRQGTGKTSSLARHLVDYAMTFQDRAIFVLDWSGSISDMILTLIARQPTEIRERLLKRVVYDELGHPEWIIPMPEFSPLYGGSYEEQVQRVANNLVKLAPELVKDAPFLAGLGLREIAPQVFRLLTAITNEHDETWQVTEAKRLMTVLPLLKNAIGIYGYKVPEAKWFFSNVYLQIKQQERELRSYAVLALLGAVEPRETKARLGFYRPGWTPKEAIKNGLIVLVNGARLINQKNTQHYLFTQAYSLIMSEINKRTPGNPEDKPVALVMDEVYSLLSIPGMAEEVGMLSPLYRSRKLELYIVLQSLSQLAPTLRSQIWSIGNIVCFAISNFDEAYEIAQQLFKYEPQTVKMEARSDNSNPIIETDRGQYLSIANWIQRMAHRECIVRRYFSEKGMDKYVRHIKQTRQHTDLPMAETLDEIKERLLKQRGVRVRDALEIVNNRVLLKTKAVDSPPQI
jgi:hypothetical protein